MKKWLRMIIILFFTITFIGLSVCSQVTAAAPVLSSASPNPAVVVAGGSEVVLTLRGSGLDQVTSCAIVRNKQIVPGVAVSLGARSASSRQIKLRAKAGTIAGDAQLRLIGGTNFLDIPLTALRITISSAPALSSGQQAAPYLPGGSVVSSAVSGLGTARTAPGAAQGSRSQLPLSFVEVAAYPGGRPIRTVAPQLPPVSISAIRAVRQGGGSATGIDFRPVQGPRGQKFMDIIIKANAVAGRYGMEFFANGKWNALQQGAFGLTIVPPQGNMTPLGAIRGIVDARTGMGTPPGPGGGIGGPGSQGDGRNIGQQFGLTNPRSNPKPGISGQRSLGDPRLMEGTDASGSDGGDTADSGGDSSGSDAGDTVDVEASSSDTTNSDGSTDVSQTIKTTDGNGNTMTDTMTAHVDANGNSTESQDVTVTDKNGNVIARSHGTGSSTPNPEKGGCTTERCREQMQWTAQMLAPIVRRMHEFAVAKITGLRGDNTAGDPSSGTRPGAGFRTGEVLPKSGGDGHTDPNPESGGSSGSSPFGPATSTTPRLDVKKSLIDPQEPGRTTPSLPPNTKPDTGPSGNETGGSPTPLPSRAR